jgi:hypothetical protein
MFTRIVLLMTVCAVLVGCGVKQIDLDAANKRADEAAKRAEDAARAAEDAKKPTSTPGFILSSKSIDAMTEAAKARNSGGVNLVTADTAINLRVGDAAVRYEEAEGRLKRETFLAKLETEKAELLLGVHDLGKTTKERDAAKEKVAALEEEIRCREASEAAAEYEAAIRDRDVELQMANREIAKSKDKEVAMIDQLAKAKDKEIAAANQLAKAVITREVSNASNATTIGKLTGERNAAVTENAILRAKVKALESAPPKVVEKIIEKKVEAPLYDPNYPGYPCGSYRAPDGRRFGAR